MLKRIVGILFCLFGCLSSHPFSQVLYEISGNNSQGKSYLFAINPLTDRDFIDSVPNTFKVFGRCKRVITEFTVKDYEAIAALRHASLLPDSVVLGNFLTPTEYSDIDDALLLTVGTGLHSLERMKPSFVTELYRTELMSRWLEYDEQTSMESFFEQVAEQKQMPVHGLDSLGETIYMLFEREPLHWQYEELKKITEYPEREVKLENDIRNAYREGRLNDIAYIIQSPDNQSTLSYSDYQVFAQRNEVWVKRLAPYLKEGKSFIALNAIYLGGEKGLISCLRKAGYKVRAVNRRTASNI